MRLDGTDDVIENATYPTTSEEFIAAHGDHTIEHGDGDETLRTVLSRLGEETYAGPADVFDAVFTAVGHEAIGRRYYSDREPPSPGEDGPTQVSF